MLGMLEVGCGVGVTPGAPTPRMVQAEIVKRRHSIQPTNVIKRAGGVFIMQLEL
jgi:hypothetical protein